MTGRRRPGSGAGRRGAFVILAIGVLGVHGCVVERLGNEVSDLRDAAGTPPRLSVAYVREVTLSEPPPPAGPGVPPRRVEARTAAAAVVGGVAAEKRESAASAAASRPSTETDPPVGKAVEKPAEKAVGEALVEASAAAGPGSAPVAPSAGTEVDAAAAAAAATAPTTAASSTPLSATAAATPLGTTATASATSSASASPSASASDPPAGFDWPASTRLSYTLTGHYRGPVQGEATVEWIRIGSHYQVHLDLQVGPSFAPLITRRLTSDGQITAAGLAPRSFAQDTQVVLQARSRIAITFGPEGVVLANGDRHASVEGLQDTASQFVQIAYLFGTRPELLRLGGAIDVPVAMPRKVDLVTYDVIGEESLTTPFGALSAIHLKPRFDWKPGELSAESWYAPQLRYLPVRIRIQQDAQTYVDLMIARRPEIAAP